jgi:hypothetical protein
MVANKLKMVLASLQRNKTTGRGYSGINQTITVEKNYFLFANTIESI